MSLLLNLSTSGLTNITQTDNFVANFNNLEFDRDKKYQIALLSYSLWYAWYNISAELGNNKFYYNNGSTDRTITITDGQYGVSDINSFIKNAISALGDNPDNIKIVGNFTTLKVDITLANSYSVTFGANSLYIILGFNNGQVLNTNGVHSSPNQPNVSNSVDALNINTSFIDSNSNLLNDNHSFCIYQLVPTSGPGSNISERISYPTYLPLNNHGNIHNVFFSITDQNNNRLNLHGEHVTLSFHIKEV